MDNNIKKPMSGLTKSCMGVIAVVMAFITMPFCHDYAKEAAADEILKNSIDSIQAVLPLTVQGTGTLYKVEINGVYVEQYYKMENDIVDVEKKKRSLAMSSLMLHPSEVFVGKIINAGYGVKYYFEGENTTQIEMSNEYLSQMQEYIENSNPEDIADEWIEIQVSLTPISKDGELKDIQCKQNEIIFSYEVYQDVFNQILALDDTARKQLISEQLNHKFGSVSLLELLASGSRNLVFEYRTKEKGTPLQIVISNVELKQEVAYMSR